MGHKWRGMLRSAGSEEAAATTAAGGIGAGRLTWRWTLRSHAQGVKRRRQGLVACRSTGTGGTQPVATGREGRARGAISGLELKGERG